MVCKCSGTVTNGVCTRCGNVYDVIAIEAYNEQKTLEGVKRYLMKESSVKGFSCWKDYDFEHATLETKTAYTSDVKRHKQQVREFLEGYSNYELLQLKEKYVETAPLNIANSILVHLGYKYKEDEKQI